MTQLLSNIVSIDVQTIKIYDENRNIYRLLNQKE